MTALPAACFPGGPTATARAASLPARPAAEPTPPTRTVRTRTALPEGRG